MASSCYVLDADIKTTATCSIVAALASQVFPVETHAICKLVTPMAFSLAAYKKKPFGDSSGPVTSLAAGATARVVYSCFAGNIGHFNVSVQNMPHSKSESQHRGPIANVQWRRDIWGHPEVRVFLPNPSRTPFDVQPDSNLNDPDSGNITVYHPPSEN